MGKTEGTCRVGTLSQFSVALYKPSCPLVATPAQGLELLPFWEGRPGTSHTSCSLVSLTPQSLSEGELGDTGHIAGIVEGTLKKGQEHWAD